MDPVDPVPYRAIHALLGDLSDELVDEALAVAGPGAGSPLSFEIRHTGGALWRGEPGAGAISKNPGEYLMFGGPGVGSGDGADDRDGSRRTCRRPSLHTRPAATSNFSEEPTDPAEQLGAEAVGTARPRSGRFTTRRDFSEPITRSNLMARAA